MYDMGTRKRALALVAQGRSLNSVSKETGASRAAIRSWQSRIEPLSGNRSRPCPRCRVTPEPPDDPAAYAYLLGLYLGDGCISTSRRGVHFLRIACADAWPGLIEACASAMQLMRPDNKIFRVRSQGCQYVTCSSKHWPCLFPQHGPGKKHDRKITLEPWQQRIVDAHPWEFVRGSSTPTGVASPTGPHDLSVASPSATSIPGTSSPTSRPTSCASSPTHSTRSASTGNSRTPATSPSPAKPQ